MAGYWELPERCRKCTKKRNDGTLMKADYRCYCLPYWGKQISDDLECPKDMTNGGTLKSIVQVQGMTVFEED